MVNYKVRSFYEKDTGTAGADVIIFDSQGDEIDTLLITTESTYNDLVEQLEGIDERYLDRTDILEILQNTVDIVNINATTLNGLSSDNFASNGHNHDTLYAPKNHVNVLGNASTNGHAKIINNLTTASYRDGEALSAYQGKLLSDRINNVISSVSNWEYLNLATLDNNCLKTYVNRSLRVVYATIDDVINYKVSRDKNNYVATRERVISGYRPKQPVYFATHTPYTTGLIQTDGKIYGKSIWSNDKSDLALNGSCWWVY